MGQAKRRGTFEERRAEALARKEQERIDFQRKMQERGNRATSRRGTIGLLALAALTFGGGRQR